MRPPLASAQRERKRETDRKVARRKAAIARGQNPRNVTGNPAPAVRITITRARVPSLPLALCVGADPDLFFSDAPGDIAQAVAICCSCPVRTECLRGATERRELYGVWGGLDFNRGHAAERRVA